MHILLVWLYVGWAKIFLMDKIINILLWNKWALYIVPNFHSFIFHFRFGHWCQRKLRNMGKSENEEQSKRIFKANMANSASLERQIKQSIWAFFRIVSSSSALYFFIWSKKSKSINCACISPVTSKLCSENSALTRYMWEVSAYFSSKIVQSMFLVFCNNIHLLVVESVKQLEVKWKKEIWMLT